MVNGDKQDQIFGGDTHGNFDRLDVTRAFDYVTICSRAFPCFVSLQKQARLPLAVKPGTARR